MKIDLANARPLALSEKIHIDEWNADIWIREMTGEQLAILKKYIKIDKNGVTTTEHEMGLVLALSIVDENGEFCFTEADVEQIEKQPLRITSPLFAEAVKLSGLGNMGIEEAKNKLKNQKKSSS